ncbi:hypothetical protein [Actinomadura sp. GTD37]|uniref:hypothetical protein n=1 Tax=Actinomadura sp. GTD37 TaxID=1778030 RepID=UPI0035C12486
MRVGTKLGVGLVAGVLAGGALSVGAVAEAQPPPQPQQQQQEEEGHGPGAIVVGPEGAAKAMDRLINRDEERTRWCRGTVLPTDGLNVRTGPGVHYRKIGTLAHNAQVWTDWDTVQRRDGYLWVRTNQQHWIADYKLGNGNGKWYVRYSNC